jgi:predicted RNA binding protein YcfA (HicA-like mRNA interferase family)
MTMKRVTPDRVYVTIVVLAEPEIPRGTLKSIIERAGLTEEEFLAHPR